LPTTANQQSYSTDKTHAPTPKRKKKKAKQIDNFSNAYLSEDTTAELWSTGNFAQSGVNNQQQSAEFKDVFGIDNKENGEYAAVEGRVQAFGIELPNIGLPAER
jgi:hypothetical protein